jgi:hypothetical protein
MTLFTVLFLLVISVKPNFIFDYDGAFREFGVGNSSKTVLPMWLFVIILALLSYYMVVYAIAFPKLKF